MRVVKSISVDEKIWESLKQMAKEQKRTASNMIEMLIELYKKKEM